MEQSQGSGLSAHALVQWPGSGHSASYALSLLGLDPIAETLADGHSYGFGLERRCADALGQAHLLVGNRHGPRWILEGDIKACCDRISHDWLWTHVPMDQQLLRKWLKAGFLEKHAWFATTEGTPQGGIVSPALANWTLDGLQRLLAEHFAQTPQRQRRSKVHLVRYADDFLITGSSQELLRDEVQPFGADFLKERGLELAREKTRITPLEEGFDFLGQNVRRYRCGKVLTKPSKRSVKTFLAKIRETIDRSGSQTAGEMILCLEAVERNRPRRLRLGHLGRGRAAWGGVTLGICIPDSTHDASLGSIVNRPEASVLAHPHSIPHLGAVAPSRSLRPAPIPPERPAMTGTTPSAHRGLGEPTVQNAESGPIPWARCAGEPTHQLPCVQRHLLARAAVGIVLPGEGNTVVMELHQAAIAQGDSVRVPS